MRRCYKNKKDNRNYYINSLIEFEEEIYAVMITPDKNELLGLKVEDVMMKDLENSELWEPVDDTECVIPRFYII